LRNFSPSRQMEGAGKAGCALHPQSRVQMEIGKRTRAYRFSVGIPAFPAQWFYGLLRDLPGEPSSFATVTSRIISAKLSASVGRQNHATLPSARVTLVSRNSRVHRIPPHVRDDSRSAPLPGETRGFRSVICLSGRFGQRTKSSRVSVVEAQPGADRDVR